MFNLENFKTFARITTEDDDALILSLGQSATDVIAGMLGLTPIEPVKALGTVRITRAQGNNNPINIPNTQKFIYPALEVTFVVNAGGQQAADKLEQDFAVHGRKYRVRA